jgi:polyhydroxyalkanoate synthesis repressor PhaR
MADVKIIKRYRNRRLYDLEDSRTITHADLAAMIRNGQRVQVIDSATNEDITLTVLGRTLLSESSRWENLKESRELFQEIISLGGDKSMSLLKNTVLASIGALQVTKEKAEKIIDDLVKRGEVDKSDRKKAVMELLEKAEKSTSQWREKITKETEKARKSASKFAKDLDWARAGDLKRLEAKVNKLAKAVKDLEEKIGGTASE